MTTERISDKTLKAMQRSRIMVVEPDDTVTTYQLHKDASDLDAVGRAVDEDGLVSPSFIVVRDRRSFDEWLVRAASDDGTVTGGSSYSVTDGALVIYRNQKVGGPNKPVWLYSPWTWREVHMSNGRSHVVDDQGKRDSRGPEVTPDVQESTGGQR